MGTHTPLTHPHLVYSVVFSFLSSLQKKLFHDEMTREDVLASRDRALKLAERAESSMKALEKETEEHR